MGLVGVVHIAITLFLSSFSFALGNTNLLDEYLTLSIALIMNSGIILLLVEDEMKYGPIGD